MERKVMVLDGGFSTQLKQYTREKVDGDPLWTAKFLALKPDLCTLAHRDFALAGADILETATYQASVEGFKNILNMPEERAREVIRSSVDLVKKGITFAEEKIVRGDLKKVKIAGSVGAYGACLHDGSEYNGNYRDKVSEEELIKWHTPRIEELIRGGVDYLAIETIPCVKEALAVIKLLKKFPSARAWISFSIKDRESISSGENFCEAVEKCWAESNQLVAIGANCFHPSMVTDLFTPLRKKRPEIPTIVYPNNSDFYDINKQRWIRKEGIEGRDLGDYIKEWIDLGISVIGGCCRTSHGHIRNISTLVHIYCSPVKTEKPDLSLIG